MGYERGDEYDCDACGGIHEVEVGKGLRVAGSSEGLDPAPYVRCPAAGVVRLDEGAGDGEGKDADADDRDDTDGDEWP